MNVLLISTYELGHQPFNLASPAAFLLQAGHEIQSLDLAVQACDDDKVRWAEFIGISTPMHTALRLGLHVARGLRKINPAAHISFYGLYAGLNADYLLAHVADSAIGGEYEQALVALVNAIARGDGKTIAGARANTQFPRQQFLTPARHLLPPLSKYAALALNGEYRLTGYVEASRGCAHTCRHCPITPMYAGRVRIVQEETILADIAQLVEMGAQHITFGDPDFLNGVKHSLQIVREMHAAWPNLTFDFTAKIEHLLEYQELLPELARLGCIFIVSAVELLNDHILTLLAKGHTRAEVEVALRLTERAGIPLRPSLMPFTPWSSVQDFIDLIEFVEAQHLVAHVDPVQYGIRLLLPPGSSLLALPETQPHLREFDEEKFTFLWEHPDPAMDRLQSAVAACAEAAAHAGQEMHQTFAVIRELAYRAANRNPTRNLKLPESAEKSPPRLTEHWFC
ncbi:MAG: CUAEP/CCAEP-tail radical SAM (seleno)protein [bacterium]